jgi:spore maturation protein CgeB
MNILVVGKKNHIPWPYYTYRGFLQNNHNVKLFYYNEYSLIERIKKSFTSNSFDGYNKLLKEFKPDIIVFVSAFFIPKEYYIIAKEYNIPTIGWVGDSFNESKAEFVDLIDKLYLFDTSLVDSALALGFDAELLQVGYDKELHKNLGKNRRESFNFIGSYTKDREQFLEKLHKYNLELYGIKWNSLESKPLIWDINNQKIDYKKLIDIYNSTKYSLNITQMNNVNRGINMRVFETIACGSCLLSDNLEDIPLCFEPDKEILIYNNSDELEEMAERLINDKSFAETIIKNGSSRLHKCNYTYKDRTKFIMDNIGK